MTTIDNLERHMKGLIDRVVEACHRPLSKLNKPWQVDALRKHQALGLHLQAQMQGMLLLLIWQQVGYHNTVPGSLLQRAALRSCTTLLLSPGPYRLAVSTISPVPTACSPHPHTHLSSRATAVHPSHHCSTSCLQDLLLQPAQPLCGLDTRQHTAQPRCCYCWHPFCSCHSAAAGAAEAQQG